MVASRLHAAFRSLSCSLFVGKNGPPDSDGALLRQFVESGDGHAFAALVARHGPGVLAICQRTLGAGPDADDAFQATFLVLARKAATLDGGRPIDGWLSRVASTTALEIRQQTARSRRREELAARPEATTSITPADDTWPLVLAEVERLSTVHREVVSVCLLAGLTQEQAAERLGWPLGTVKTRLARARELLRDRLARRGLAPAIAATAGLSLVETLPAAVPARLTAAVCQAGSGTEPTAVVRSLADTAMRCLPGGMTRTMGWALGLAVIVGVAGVGVAMWDAVPVPPAAKDDKSAPEEDAKAAGQIKALIPEAASIPNGELRALATPGATPKIEDIKNWPLSMVFFGLAPQEGAKDIQYVREFPKPDELAKTMSRSQLKGYATYIQPDFITDCTCKVTGNTAKGSVSFRAKGIYEGKAEFSARRVEGAWRVNEFYLPGCGIRTQRQEDGTWKKSQDKPQE